MSYVRDLSEVNKIIETTNAEEVNQKIKNGWLLLYVITTSQNNVKFSLGRIKNDNPGAG